MADRLRPQKLDDIVGQQHLLGKGRILRRIIEEGNIPNMIFYGPPGVGKTTLAVLIAACTDKKLHKLNATTASTSDMKQIMEEIDTLSAPKGVLLYLDEIQYFNKKQQQILLEYLENGKITLIASTTENPYFYVYGAILSRATVFEFYSISPREIEPAVERAFEFLMDEQKLSLRREEGVVSLIAEACGGDVRKAVNTVELSVLAAQIDKEGRLLVTKEDVQQLAQKSAMKYDKEGDAHYDILSAFQKSMRGSDPNAALHYLARLLEGGDMLSACRRLMVCACEDVGLAYPQIIPIVKAAVDAALQIGMPEARIPLADAVVLVCNSPKSNTAYAALDKAIADIRQGKTGDIPPYLKDAHYEGAEKMGRGLTYQYTHLYPGHWIEQQYLPDELKNTIYYEYGDNKNEQAAKAYWEQIKRKK